MRQAVLEQMRAIQPADSSSEEAIECLVKQADFYANFLLSKFEKSVG